MIMEKYKYSPIVITGPSGAGKTELIDYITDKNPLFVEAYGYTTRPRRESDRENIQTIPKEEFRELIASDQLIEYGYFSGNYYGIKKDELKKLNDHQVIFNVGYTSAKAIKELNEDTCMIYLLPPDMMELKRRLGTRGFERYYLGVKETIRNSENYDYLLVSQTNNLEATYSDFMNIVQGKEKAKEKQLMRKNRDFINNYYR